MLAALIVNTECSYADSESIIKVSVLNITPDGSANNNLSRSRNCNKEKHSSLFKEDVLLFSE